MKRGKGAGPTGLRWEHIRTAIRANPSTPRQFDPQVDAEQLRTFCNYWLTCTDIPEHLARAHAAALLYAKKKEGNRTRPLIGLHVVTSTTG